MIIIFKIENAKYENRSEMAICFVDGFFSEEDRDKKLLFAEDLFKIFFLIADVALVAKSDGCVVGYVFGGYKKLNIKKLCLFVPHGFSYCLKNLFNAYGFQKISKQEIIMFINRAMRLHSNCKADAELLNISTLKSYRKGLGTALVDALIAELKFAGCNSLKVLTETAVNYHFYEKYGFTLIEEYDMRIKNYENIAKTYYIEI